MGPDAPRRRRRAWGIDEIRAGLILAVQERRRRGVSRRTQALLKEIAKDLDGVPSWSPVDRVARHHDLSGDDLLREAERAVAVERSVAG